MIIVMLLLMLNGGERLQDEEKKTKRFTGILIDESGNPVPDAYVINYRNYHGVTSRKNGRFSISVEEGDSVVISHISFERKVLHVVDSVQNYTLNFASFEISPVIIQDQTLKMKYFEKNMERIRKDIQKMIKNNWSNGRTDSYRNYRTTIRRLQNDPH